MRGRKTKQNAFLQLGTGLTAALPACAWGVGRPLAELRCQMALRWVLFWREEVDERRSEVAALLGWSAPFYSRRSYFITGLQPRALAGWPLFSFCRPSNQKNNLAWYPCIHAFTEALLPTNNLNLHLVSFQNCRCNKIVVWTYVQQRHGRTPTCLKEVAHKSRSQKKDVDRVDPTAS
jgi:hypothetical protein